MTRPLRRRRPALLGRLAAFGSVVTSALLLLAGPAAAQTVEVLRTDEPADGVRHQVLRIRLDDGAIARGNLVRWQEDRSGVALRPVLARDTIAGTETTPSMSQRALRDGALVGVNGGYFLPRPTATPNGPFVLDGQLRSGPAVGASGSRLSTGRGTVGIRTNGGVRLDRLQPEMTLQLPTGTWAVDEVNRTPRCPASGSVTCPLAGEVLVFDDGFGAATPLPAGSTVAVLEAARLPATGRLTTTVRSVEVRGASSRATVPPGGLLLVAHGPERGPSLAQVAAGSTITIDVALRPAAAPGSSWDDLAHAVPGAPLLLRGRVQQPVLFSSAITREDREALGDAHRLRRQPRTAIGRTGSGELLLLTVDGRNSGWSVGMTLLELTEVFQRLGARDAVNLDGGGSTTMTMHGAVINRPSENNRGSSNALMLHVPQRTWFLRDARSGGPANSTGTFAFSGDRVLACDVNGDGRDTPVTFADGRWVVSNQRDGGGALTTFRYGFQPGDLPLCGDWNGNGRDGIGVQRGNRFLLRNSASAGSPHHDFRYGRASDVAVVGDWNGNGFDTIGVRRGDRYFLRNRLSGGPADHDFHYGRPSDGPVVGDWNGNGRSSLGVRRGDRYFIRNRLSGGPADLDFHYGRASDLPVSGDWNGDSRTSLGVVR